MADEVWFRKLHTGGGTVPVYGRCVIEWIHSTTFGVWIHSTTFGVWIHSTTFGVCIHSTTFGVCNLSTAIRPPITPSHRNPERVNQAMGQILLEAACLFHHKESIIKVLECKSTRVYRKIRLVKPTKGAS
jgi:hypothetical protein